MNNYSLPSSPTTPPYSPGTPALTPPCNKEPILQDTLHGYALNTDPTQNSLFDEQTASVMCRHYNRLTTPAFHWPRMHQCHMWHMNNKYFDKTPGGTKSAVMTAMAAMITVMGKTNETVSKMHSCEIKSPIIKATFSRQSYFRTEAIQHIGTAISFYSHDEREKMYYDRALDIPCINEIHNWMHECSDPKTMPFGERLFATILADTVLMSVSCMLVRFCDYNQSEDGIKFQPSLAIQRICEDTAIFAGISMDIVNKVLHHPPSSVRMRDITNSAAALMKRFAHDILPTKSLATLKMINVKRHIEATADTVLERVGQPRLFEVDPDTSLEFMRGGNDLWTITPHHLEQYADKVDEVDIRYLWRNSQEARGERADFVYDDQPWYWVQPKENSVWCQDNNNDK